MLKKARLPDDAVQTAKAYATHENATHETEHYDADAHDMVCVLFSLYLVVFRFLFRTFKISKPFSTLPACESPNESFVSDIDNVSSDSFYNTPNTLCPAVTF
jgi:hypothetical protein